MLKILQKGLQVTKRIDPALLGTAATAGFIETDISNATLLGLKGGRLVAQDANGYVKLADGATEAPIGFLINDAVSGFYENKPALAGQTSVAYGQAVVVTDQIVATETFAPGDKLYAGTGANVGLVTKTAPAGTPKVIGVANSAASAAAPELEILVA